MGLKRIRILTDNEILSRYLSLDPQDSSSIHALLEYSPNLLEFHRMMREHRQVFNVLESKRITEKQNHFSRFMAKDAAFAAKQSATTG